MLNTCIILHPYTANKDIGAGHDRYAYELIKHLPDNNISLSLLESGQLSTMSQAAFAELKIIWRLFREKKADIFHATATMNAMAPITSRAHPLITTIHDVLWFFVKSDFDSKLKFKLKTYGINRAAQKSDGIIVPFRSTLEFLVNDLKVNPNKVFIVPYGVDHDQFYPMQNGENLKRPDFLPEGRKNVLFVGAINLGKGIDTLINCFESVVFQVPEAHLVIGSKGWDIPFIKALWEESPVKDHIHFSGFIPEQELRSAYIYADVTAFPSRYGFGLSVLESMACGTPTISGRTLDAPEFVEDAGLLTDPNSTEELAEQIIKSLSNSSLHEELSKKGIAKAGNYRWSKTASLTAEVYKEFSK